MSEKLICPKCGKTLNSKEDLEEHKKEHMKNEH